MGDETGWTLSARSVEYLQRSKAGNHTITSMVRTDYMSLPTIIDQVFFLAEFQETRKEHDFFTICRTPELACEVTLQVLYYHEAARVH